ncbi:MAG: RNA 2',3'-cyclic phosphodiesterase, partial [Gaiella sp.]
RLFLALELPTATRAAIASWAAETIPAELRRVRPDDLHVTLAFLGRRPVQELPGVLETLRACAHGVGPCALALAGWHETRSVGMLVLDDPTGNAAALAAALRRELEALGMLRPERRPWRPHVTVVRFERRPRLRVVPPAMGTFVPSDAAAYVSRLHPTGARYTAVGRVPLDPLEPRRMTG